MPCIRLWAWPGSRPAALRTHLDKLADCLGSLHAGLPHQAMQVVPSCLFSPLLYGVARLAGVLLPGPRPLVRPSYFRCEVHHHKRHGDPLCPACAAGSLPNPFGHREIGNRSTNRLTCVDGLPVLGLSSEVHRSGLDQGLNPIVGMVLWRFLHLLKANEMDEQSVGHRNLESARCSLVSRQSVVR